jgi:tetratricopeptide (TPR) repeat protein
MVDQPVSARELLERGAYKEAAEAFLAVGEYASAARAFVCVKAFRPAAECYMKAGKPVDAARLFLLLRDWKRASDLYTLTGDATRAELAMEQYQKEQEALRPKVEAVPAPEEAKAPPPPPPDPFPEGPIWQLMKVGDYVGASQIYLKQGHSEGWILLDEARTEEARRALGETLFQACDYAVAADAFRRVGEDNRAAQCLSLAGLNEEAAHLYMRAGQRSLAAQHLEKASAWEQAAEIYREDGEFLDAARCLERGDDPVKAAALYLKAKRQDLALPLLQGIAPKHRQFAQCRLLAGKILFQKGERDLALSFLAPLADMEIRSDEAFEAFYQLAVLMELAGEAEKAADLYLRLQKTRFDYKDVKARLERISKAPPPAAPGAPPRKAPQSKPAPPSQGAPAPAPAPSPAPPPVAASAPPPPPSPQQAVIDLTPLRDCSLFHRLDLDELRRLWAIGTVMERQTGDVLLRAGQPSDGLFIVLEGGLTITPDPADMDLAVGFLGRGDYVGLGCLIQGPPRTNALVAQGSTRLLFLPAKSLEVALSSEPDLGLRVFRSIAEHLSQTLMAQQKK